MIENANFSRTYQRPREQEGTMLAMLTHVGSKMKVALFLFLFFGTVILTLALIDA